MTTHMCDSGNFSREVCPEPCGAMHAYCTVCGQPADSCAFDAASWNSETYRFRLDTNLIHDAVYSEEADCA